jgi:hypothetical protein
MDINKHEGFFYKGIHSYHVQYMLYFIGDKHQYMNF